MTPAEKSKVLAAQSAKKGKKQANKSIGKRKVGKKKVGKKSIGKKSGRGSKGTRRK